MIGSPPAIRIDPDLLWWCDGRSDRPRDRQGWTKGRALASLVHGKYSRDPIAGALWYHADCVRPNWRRERTPGRNTKER